MNFEHIGLQLKSSSITSTETDSLRGVASPIGTSPMPAPGGVSCT